MLFPTKHEILKFQKLSKKINGWLQKCSRAIVKSGEEIAIEAIEYALNPGLNGTGDYPKNKEHLFRTAKRFAKFAFLNEIKKAKKVAFSLDDHKNADEGEVSEVGSVEAQCAITKYNAEKQHKDPMELGRHALRLLDDFLLKKGVSPRDISVYKAWELYKTPTKTVSEKYEISSNNLHKIVSTINQILSCNGRELLDAA